MRREEAAALVERILVGATVQACVPYKGDFLVRVEHPSENEKDYDPFFLVKASTGEIQEFSVLTDGDPLEVAKAFEGEDE